MTGTTTLDPSALLPDPIQEMWSEPWPEVGTCAHRRVDEGYDDQDEDEDYDDLEDDGEDEDDSFEDDEIYDDVDLDDDEEDDAEV